METISFGGDSTTFTKPSPPMAKPTMFLWIWPLVEMVLWIWLSMEMVLWTKTSFVDDLWW